MSKENIKKIAVSAFIDMAAGVPFLDRGRDFSGWDCWGLIVRAYRALFGLDLVDPAVPALSSQEAAAHFEKNCKNWQEVTPGHEAPGDVVLFRVGRFVAHAGMVVKPGYMLHSDRSTGTCVYPYRTGLWKNSLAGIYRHAELAH